MANRIEGLAEVCCDDYDVWVGEQQMCNFMQKCYNSCSGGVGGPEGELIFKGKSWCGFLKVGINEFLNDGPLHNSGQDWSNGNWTKIGRLHRIGDFGDWANPGLFPQVWYCRCGE